MTFKNPSIASRQQHIKVYFFSPTLTEAVIPTNCEKSMKMRLSKEQGTVSVVHGHEWHLKENEKL